MSDQPFKVGLGRFTLYYEEGDHKLMGSVEFDGRRLQIYTSSIRKWRIPFENEPITPEKRAEIVRNVEAYLQTTREPYTINDSPG